MTATPVLRIRPMAVADLPAVQLIERTSFSTPWPPQAYRQELETNRLAHYLVATMGDQIVAYGGVWLMVDEAHITTFAVHQRFRRRRIGERLLLALLDLSVDRHAREATLEVRLSNLAARRLYEKYGFRGGIPALQRQRRGADRGGGAAGVADARRVSRLRQRRRAPAPSDPRPESATPEGLA
jgi:ribosomal-protein-alanine N-acetyltransferase